MRLSGTKATAVHQYRGLGNQLWDLAGNRPSLDLPFAETKSLVDATTGTNLVDFTRASPGTYVGSDGLIKKATTNLLLQSEDFATTWVLSRVAISANSQTAPNGTTTADTITGDGTTAFPNGVNQSTTVFAATGTKVFSVYAKAGTNSFVQLYVGGNVNVFANFDLISGDKGTVGSQSSAAITPVGNGWYRCSISTSEINPTSVAIILVNSSSAVRAETAGSTNSIYLWGAQLEQSSTVGEYVKTTITVNSAPRFTHDPVTGESLGLLVEENRTNFVKQSEAFDTTTPLDQAWLPVGDGLAVSPNQATAPNGTITADLVSTNAGTADKGLQDFITTSTAGVTYTVSLFAKAASSNFIRLHYEGGGGTAALAVNLATGQQVLSVNADGVSIQPYVNGWYRLIITKTSTASAGMAIRFLVCNSDGSAPGATGSVYVWGAQFEIGSFPTSYIHTFGSEVTRQPDLCQISGSNFSSWYRQDAGTVFVEGAVPVGVSSSRALLSIDDGTNNERIQIRHNATTARTQLVADNGSVQFNAPLVTDSFPPGEYRKLAIAVKANDFAVVVDDAGTVATGTGTMPTPTQLQIGNAASNPQPCKPIKRLTYWPARLPNETLQTITK